MKKGFTQSPFSDCIAVIRWLRTSKTQGVWGLRPARGSTPAPRPNSSGDSYISIPLNCYENREFAFYLLFRSRARHQLLVKRLRYQPDRARLKKQARGCSLSSSRFWQELMTAPRHLLENVKFSLESPSLVMKILLQRDLSHSEIFCAFYTDDRTNDEAEVLH